MIILDVLYINPKFHNNMICIITFNIGGEADSELLETLSWITQLKLTMLGFELTLVSWPSSQFLHHVSFLAAKRTSIWWWSAEWPFYGGRFRFPSAEGVSPEELVAVTLCTKPWWLVSNKIRTVLSSMGKGLLTLKLSATSSHAHQSRLRELGTEKNTRHSWEAASRRNNSRQVVVSDVKSRPMELLSTNQGEVARKYWLPFKIIT